MSLFNFKKDDNTVEKEDPKLGWFERQVINSLEDKIIPMVLKHAPKLAAVLDKTNRTVVITVIKGKPYLAILDSQLLIKLPKRANNRFNEETVVNLIDMTDSAAVETVWSELQKSDVA